MRCSVAGARGRRRVKMLCPGIDQSMIPRAVRQVWRSGPSDPRGACVRFGQRGRRRRSARMNSRRRVARIAVVGGRQDLGLDVVAEGAQRVEERPVGVARLALERPAVLAERSPVRELGDVLNQDAPDIQRFGPAQHDPRGCALLIGYRLAAARVGVVRALRAGDQEVQLPVRDDVARIDALEPLAEVLRVRLVRLMRLDRRLPVVDGGQFQAVAEPLARQAEALARAAGPAEQVRCLDRPPRTSSPSRNRHRRLRRRSGRAPRSSPRIGCAPAACRKNVTDCGGMYQPSVAGLT